MSAPKKLPKYKQASMLHLARFFHGAFSPYLSGSSITNFEKATYIIDYQGSVSQGFVVNCALPNGVTTLSVMFDLRTNKAHLGFSNYLDTSKRVALTLDEDRVNEFLSSDGFITSHVLLLYYRVYESRKPYAKVPYFVRCSPASQLLTVVPNGATHLAVDYKGD